MLHEANVENECATVLNRLRTKNINMYSVFLYRKGGLFFLELALLKERLRSENRGVKCSSVYPGESINIDRQGNRMEKKRGFATLN